MCLTLSPGREPQKSIDVLICDVNGVLVDSTATVIHAFTACAAHYAFRFSDTDFQRIKHLGLLDAYKVLDPGGDSGLRRLYHLHYLRERFGEMRAHPGVHEALAAARANGIRVGAATSYGEVAEACLVNAGLYSLLDCLATQEEVKRPKPHPDVILRVLTLLGNESHADSERAVYVGDSIVDIEAGRAAGVRTVGVTCGVCQDAEIRAAEPDCVIGYLNEVRPLFIDMNEVGHIVGALRSAAL